MGTDLFLALGGVLALGLGIEDVVRNAGRRVGTLLGSTLPVATGVMLLANGIAGLSGVTGQMTRVALIPLSFVVAYGIAFLVREIAIRRKL